MTLTRPGVQEHHLAATFGKFVKDLLNALQRLTVWCSMNANTML